MFRLYDTASLDMAAVRAGSLRAPRMTEVAFEAYCSSQKPRERGGGTQAPQRAANGTAGGRVVQGNEENQGAVMAMKQRG